MLPKTYEPKAVEAEFADKWQERKLFAARIPKDKSKKPFVIVLPPPNITGALHMGHALNDTLQDCLIRANRMLGREAYWVPGADHGGIATQNVMEKKISKEKHLHRRDLGREKFIEETWQWYRECGNTILSQLKKLGCAFDLSPENVRFTMDEQRAKAVFEAFKILHGKKLIYRGERMINWCVRCGTALSDIEVEHEPSHSKLWHIHYPMPDGGKGIIVATTRPETMFGDTAVAVNPDDERYKNMVGKKVRLPLTERLIPIIADQTIDKNFGTGALKVTPAHDVADYEIGQRHKLPLVKVISFEGKMVDVPPPYLGLDTTACRQKVLQDLRDGGLLPKEENYSHNVGACYRCHQHIEPLPSEQWFVRMKELSLPAIAAAREEKIKFHPQSWKKPFVDWLENIQDWCISRQIWWGHRIPVWYCKKCSEGGLIYDEKGELSRVSFEHGAKPVVSFEKPSKCPLCQGADLVQDPDVLDTWFSSGLWPFSVFGWPQKTPELKFYYPTSVLATGYEILYLWVARMVMMGVEFTGQLPFSDVYIHGIVRDKHGKKMSKSLGNVTDPLDLIEKYGTDAVRFSLILRAYPGKDIPFSEDSITGPRNFCNKLYNAARFILMNLPENPPTFAAPQNVSELSDRWILDRYNNAITQARSAIADYDIALAAQTLYSFLWDDFCDWYVELAKPRLSSPEKERVLAILIYIMRGTIKALHPFMPFITEELARQFKDGGKEFLIEKSYPSPEPKFADAAAVKEMEIVMGVTCAIRTIRSQFGVSPAARVTAFVTSKNTAATALVKKYENYITLLAKTEKLEISQNIAKPKHAATSVFGDLTAYVLLEGIIDFEKEKERLQKELERQNKEIDVCGARLNDPKFRSNAPEDEVKKVTDRLAQAELKILQINAAVKDLQ